MIIEKIADNHDYKDFKELTEIRLKLNFIKMEPTVFLN
jgi:hypothetical protein